LTPEAAAPTRKDACQDDRLLVARVLESKVFF
jgi:hypothetical protein